MKILFATILVGILFLFSNEYLNAQATKAKHNSIAVSPLNLAAGHYGNLRIRLQHSIKFRFAFGLDMKYYFPGNYPGYQVSPFVKLFIAKENTEGVYLYGTMIYGQNKGLPEHRSMYYECYGEGGGAGFQLLFGKAECWQLDIALGLKSVVTHSNLSIENVPERYLDYYVVGPAAIVDGLIAVGFRF